MSENGQEASEPRIAEAAGSVSTSSGFGKQTNRARQMEKAMVAAINYLQGKGVSMSDDTAGLYREFQLRARNAAGKNETVNFDEMYEELGPKNKE